MKKCGLSSMDCPIYHAVYFGGTQILIVRAERRLPGERCETRYCREVGVPGHERQIELAGHSGYPNVVVRDQPAGFGKFRLHPAVRLAGRLVRHQKGGGLQKIADQSAVRSGSVRRCATTTFVSSRTLPAVFIDLLAAFLDRSEE